MCGLLLSVIVIEMNIFCAAMSEFKSVQLIGCYELFCSSEVGFTHRTNEQFASEWDVW